MTNLNSPAPGDNILADDIDQIMTILNSALGLTVRSQTALGRLELPSVASHPGSPANYQTWVRSDLGVGGAPFMRGSDGQNLRLLGRVSKSAELGAGISTTSTSLADATGLSVTDTFTGRRIRIKLVPPAAYIAGNSHVYVTSTGSVSAVAGELVAVVDSTSLGAAPLVVAGASANPMTLGMPASAFEWDYQPAAGPHTIKIQYRVTSGSMQIFITQGVALLIQEYGD